MIVGRAFVVVLAIAFGAMLLVASGVFDRESSAGYPHSHPGHGAR